MKVPLPMCTPQATIGEPAGGRLTVCPRGYTMAIESNDLKATTIAFIPYLFWLGTPQSREGLLLFAYRYITVQRPSKTENR